MPGAPVQPPGQPGDEVWGRVGQLIALLQQAPGPLHMRIWQELSPWFKTLVSSASIDWVRALSGGWQCHVVLVDGARHQPCTRIAIGACVSCGKPACLGHAFIDGTGKAVCFVCVSEMSTLYASGRAASGAKDPHLRDLDWAFRLFHLKPGASAEEIRAAHRKLSAKYHPDRVKGNAQKAKAEEKFKEVQVAFATLMKQAAA